MTANKNQYVNYISDDIFDDDGNVIGTESGFIVSADKTHHEDYQSSLVEFGLALDIARSRAKQSGGQVIIIDSPERIEF